MSLFQRAHDIVAAKANKALDAAENPNEMLDYSYDQMLDHITRVRQALVDVAAARKRIELQEQQLQHTVGHLADQAQAALGQGREDLAREALSRKAAAQQQVDGMEAQHQELGEQQAKLEQTLAQLQERVNNFRSQKEVMKARYTAAQASAAINAQAAGIAGEFGDSGATLASAQDKIATMQARAGALDELLQSGVLEDVGGDTDDIQQELDEAGTSAQVDRELAALKEQLALPAADPAPAAGDPPRPPRPADQPAGRKAAGCVESRLQSSSWAAARSASGWPRRSARRGSRASWSSAGPSPPRSLRGRTSPRAAWSTSTTGTAPMSCTPRACCPPGSRSAASPPTRASRGSTGTRPRAARRSATSTTGGTSGCRST